MKTSKKKIEEDSEQKSSAQTLDPFAVDFFGVKDTPLEIDDVQGETSQKNLITQKLNLGEIEGLDWYKYLSTTTTEESLFSNKLLEFPKYLNVSVIDCLIKTFARCTKLEKKNIKFEIESVEEVNLSDTLNGLNNQSQVFLTLNSNLNKHLAHIAIERKLSSELVDFILGGKGQENDSLRKLSAIEKTLIEFLGINILSDLYNDLSISNLNVLNVSNEIDVKLQKNVRGARITLDISIGKINGKIVFLSPIELLNSLENARASVFLKSTATEKFRKLNKKFKNFKTTVLLGTTSVNANDIPFLEKEDVVLIDKKSQFWNKHIQVSVGDGTNYYVSGSFKTSDKKDILSDEIIFEVEEILSEKDTWTQPKREKMDIKSEIESEKVVDNESKDNVSDDANLDEANNQKSFETNVERSPIEVEIDEDSLASLENVMVNLRVNLGGRRLSLGEVQEIRVGQIIELGCRPTDPVEIVTDGDNKPIATGELLEIEGHLGVRLTKILV